MCQESRGVIEVAIIEKERRSKNKSVAVIQCSSFAANVQWMNSRWG